MGKLVCNSFDNGIVASLHKPLDLSLPRYLVARHCDWSTLLSWPWFFSHQHCRICSTVLLRQTHQQCKFSESRKQCDQMLDKKWPNFWIHQKVAQFSSLCLAKNRHSCFYLKSDFFIITQKVPWLFYFFVFSIQFIISW